MRGVELRSDEIQGDQGNNSSSLTVGMPNHTNTTSTVVIHTGNVRRCNHLQSKTRPTTVEEVLTAFKCTINCWRKYNAGDFVLSKKVIGHPKLMDKIEVQHREDKKVIVKLFVMACYQPGFIKEAVEQVLQTLDIATIDTFVLKFDAAVDSEDFKSAWRELEVADKAGQIKELAACDLSKEQLDRLSESATVPPAAVQLYVFGGQDVSEIKQYRPKYRVLSHEDSAVPPLASVDLQDVMDKTLQGLPTITPVTVSPPSSPMLNDREVAMLKQNTAAAVPAQHHHSHHHHDSHLQPVQQETITLAAPAIKWQPLWLVRYNVVDIKRSVVDSIGYVINAKYTV